MNTIRNGIASCVLLFYFFVQLMSSFFSLYLCWVTFIPQWYILSFDFIPSGYFIITIKRGLRYECLHKFFIYIINYLKILDKQVRLGPNLLFVCY